MLALKLLKKGWIVAHLNRMWIKEDIVAHWRYVCVLQATTLLTMDKYSMQDVQNIHNTCFKLNSLQLHALMTNYHCAPDEPYIPPVRQMHARWLLFLRSVEDIFVLLLHAAYVFAGTDRPCGGCGGKHSRWTGKEWWKRGSAGGRPRSSASLSSSWGWLLLRCGAKCAQRSTGLSRATAAKR